MADEILKRDENHRAVGAAVTFNAAEEVRMLRMDPTTGYLIVDLDQDAATAANMNPIARRDQNHRPVMLGYNATTDTTQEILTDANGYLLIDLLIVP